MSKVSSLPGDVGAKILSGQEPIGCSLESGPPLPIDQDFVLQPVANQLLARLPASREGLHFLGQAGLGPATNLDGSFQRKNVRFIHGHAGYTNRFVFVNNPVCVTDNKKVCNVVDLEVIRARAVPRKAAKLKPAPRLKKERKAIPGPDGKTIGDRIRLAMAYRSGQLRKPYRQVDLLREVNAYLKAPAHAPIVSQQNLSAMLRSSSISAFLPAIAKVCGVDSTWLSMGIGEMIDQ